MIRHSPDRYHVREDAATRFGGHSLVVDSFIHRIYIAYFGSVAVYEAVPGEMTLLPEAGGANPAFGRLTESGSDSHHTSFMAPRGSLFGL
jgi:hypothetical protein